MSFPQSAGETGLNRSCFATQNNAKWQSLVSGEHRKLTGEDSQLTFCIQCSFVCRAGYFGPTSGA